MRKVKWVVLVVFCFLLNVSSVFASASKFEPTIVMEQEITNNQVVLIIGYKGEEIYKLSHMISYEESMLTLESIAPLESFIVDYTEKDDGKFKTLSIDADSVVSLLDTNYAVITFSLKDKFKVGSSADVFFYTYDAEGPSYKSRHKGYHLELKRDTATEMLYLRNEITNKTKGEYMFYEYFFVIIILLVVILVLLFFLLFVLPSRKKKKIEKEEKKQYVVEEKKENIEPFKLDINAIEKLGEESEVPIPKSEKIELSSLNPFQSVSQEPKYAALPIEQNPQIEEIKEEKEDDIYSFEMEMPSKKQEVEMPQVKEEELPKKKEEEDLLLFQPMFEDNHNSSKSD